MVLATRNEYFASSYGPHIYLSNGKESVHVSLESQIVALALNKDASFMLAATEDKKLTVYRIGKDVSLNAELVESRDVPRNTTSMITTTYLQDGNQLEAVLLAANAGEVMAYPVPHVTSNEGKSLLAHTTSIITDIAVNIDGSMLLSADRDEKIRVSNFPATTLVQSYCLGHRQCVRKIATSVKSPSLFVSVGLDDTIKLWNISTGELLDSSDLEVDGETDTKHCGLSVCPTTNLVAVSRNSSKNIELFQITDEKKLHRVRKETSNPQPDQVQFLLNGQLLVSYKEAPFLQLFELHNNQFKAIDLPNQSRFAEAAEKTVLTTTTNEDDGAESEDGELRKKKLKATHWKAKLPGTKATEE